MPTHRTSSPRWASLGFGALAWLSWGEGRAQQATALDRFEPTTSAGAFSVPWAEIEGERARVSGGLVFSHADTLLAIQDVDAERRIAAPVGHQTVLHAVAGVNVSERLHVGASFPFVLAQGGETSALGSAPSGATFGDLRLGARVALPVLPERTLTVSLGADVWLPTGDDAAFASSGTVRVAPRVIVGGDAEVLRWSVLGGTRLVPASAGSLVGSELEVGGALGVRVGPALLGPELVAHVSAEDVDARVDAIAGFEARLGGQVSWGPLRFGLAAGPGFGEAPGVPRFRVIASVRAEHDVGGSATPTSAPPSSPGAAHRATPLAHEGAPAAPATSAPAPAIPAPPPVVLDAPAPPAAPSTPSLSIQGDQIVALEPIRFETGTARIDAVSDPLLDRIAQLFEAHPELARVAVDGHTDARGNARRNTDLSRGRALAVMRALVSRGVDARRLEARGFGPSRPVANDATEEGRAQNRRVEFVVRRRTDRGKEGWVDGSVD